jgi:hypothetical protein
VIYLPTVSWTNNGFNCQMFSKFFITFLILSGVKWIMIIRVIVIMALIIITVIMVKIVNSVMTGIIVFLVIVLKINKTNSKDCFQLSIIDASSKVRTICTIFWNLAFFGIQIFTKHILFDCQKSELYLFAKFVTEPWWPSGLNVQCSHKY